MLFPDDDAGRLLSFELIGQAEKKLAFSDQRFADGKYYFDAWYQAMNSMFYRQPARYAKTLEKWKAVNPDSGTVIIADALFHLGQGWEARGEGYANTVSKEGWEIYRRKLEEADAVIDSAPDDIKRTAPWYQIKLSIAYQTADAARAQSTFRAAVDAWPYYDRLYKTAINYSMPRWGGGFDEGRIRGEICLRQDEVQRRCGVVCNLLRRRIHWQ